MKKKRTGRHILFYLILIAAVVLICASLFAQDAEKMREEERF